MNPTLTARVETFDLGNGLHLSEASRLSITEAANGINANPLNVFDTLDKVAAFLRAGLTNPVNNLGNPSNWHVHQGGHHVALSFVANGNATRVLFVTEVLPEPVFYDEGAVDAPVVDHERNAEWQDDAIAVPTPGGRDITDEINAAAEARRIARVAPNAALQAIVAGTYDQKPGDEPAAREAAERRNRVMGYVAAFTDREGRAYAAAYAHACDEIGVDDAAEALTRDFGLHSFGLTSSRRTTIRRGVLAALLDPKPVCRNCAGSGFIGNTATRCSACAQTPPPAAPEAAGEATDDVREFTPEEARQARVQAVVDSYTVPAFKHYAAAYAHWLDEVGVEGAAERFASAGLTYGVHASNRTNIRRAILRAAKAVR